MVEAGELDDGPAQAGSRGGNASIGTSGAGAAPRPAGTSVLVPVVCKSTWELLHYPVTTMQLVSGAGKAFVGYATKVLLSSMFADMFGVSQLAAAYLAGGSLVLFALGRFAVPYFLMDHPRFGASALAISIAAQAVTAVVYAVLPLIAGDGDVSGGASWRLVGFVAAKSIAGLAFAVGAVVAGALGVQLFGTANMRLIMVPGWFLFGLGGAAGPIVAYDTAAARVSSGMGYARAYALYFYLAAAAAALNVGLMAWMHVMERRALLVESKADPRVNAEAGEP
uniref:Nodulin-like domain-containing protein n=1 Tax=Zooxanthella nutricula TaxID=1333877 RepID=A0A6V0BZC7_9DINO|mmetsp:Transcript_99184/g.303256  ORF Transcript_99184/g.303256 Transcript_99184/m.303256 type:complete len:281 (+) Transcript_99184:723-1565(+)